MRILQQRARAASLLLACTLSVSVSGAFAETSAEQQKRLERVQKNIEKLKQELEKTRSTRNEIRDAIEKSEKNIINLKKKANTLETQIEQNKQTLNSLNSETSALVVKKKAQQAQVSQHIHTAYRLKGNSQIGALLNQQDPSTIARHMRYFKYIVEARSKKITAFSETLDRLHIAETRKKAEANKLDSNYKALKSQQSLLASAQQRRTQTILSLEKTLKSRTGELSTLEVDRKNLSKLLNQVASILSDTDLAGDTTKFSVLKGKLPWPAKGRILHRYGSSRVGNHVKWQGTLIAATNGTPVRSIHHGRVVFSDYLRGHGLLIIIDHGAGYLSLYAHNESLFKSLGDWVSAGEIISKVGNTGGQKIAGLYFELRYNGKPQNPSRWLKPA